MYKTIFYGLVAGVLFSLISKSKKGLGEKKEIVAWNIFQGLKRDHALSIADISKHQYYHKPIKGKRGRKPTGHTLRVLPDDNNVERVDDSETDRVELTLPSVILQEDSV